MIWEKIVEDNHKTWEDCPNCEYENTETKRHICMLHSQELVAKILAEAGKVVNEQDALSGECAELLNIHLAQATMIATLRSALAEHVCVKAIAGAGMNAVEYHPVDSDECSLCKALNITPTWAEVVVATMKRVIKYAESLQGTPRMPVELIEPLQAFNAAVKGK